MKTITRQRLIILALILVIFALLALLRLAYRKLREKDTNGRIARGRRAQARMKARPFRFYEENLDCNGNPLPWDEVLAELENGGGDR